MTIEMENREGVLLLLAMRPSPALGACPYAVLNLVDRTAQLLEFALGDEAPKEVTRSRWVRGPDGAEHFQQRLVLLEECHVLEAGPAPVEHQRLGQDVV